MGMVHKMTAPPASIDARTPVVVHQAGEVRSARVESLRAVAAVAVLVAHVFGVAHAYGATVYRGYWHRLLLGGGFGVYLFFTLSGYLLYLPFARRDFGAGTEVRLGRYLRNRALRIFPLYYLVLVVSCSASSGGRPGANGGVSCSSRRASRPGPSPGSTAPCGRWSSSWTSMPSSRSWPWSSVGP